MGSLLSEAGAPERSAAEAEGQREVMLFGSRGAAESFAFERGLAEGVSERWDVKTFCRKQRKSKARVKARSVARRGSRPFESTASRRTESFCAAAPTIWGRKKQGKIGREH